jgi:hypothetical protein
VSLTRASNIGAFLSIPFRSLPAFSCNNNFWSINPYSSINPSSDTLYIDRSMQWSIITNGAAAKKIHEWAKNMSYICIKE